VAKGRYINVLNNNNNNNNKYKLLSQQEYTFYKTYVTLVPQG